MARCCGGRNAGKPITVPRYLLGLGVFVGYHSAVAAGLHAAALAVPGLRTVRDFQRSVFRDELGEILRREGLNVGGLLRPSVLEAACEAPLQDPLVFGQSVAASSD